MAESQDWRIKSQRVVSPAFSGLRMYRRTAILLVMTATVALAVLIPLSRGPHDAPIAGSDPTLLPGQGWGIQWGNMAESPGTTQHRAGTLLFQLLLGTGFATLATATLTILTLSVARGTQRETEVAVRRAVGASRGELLAAALLEAGVLCFLALGLGIGAGLVGGRLARMGWPPMVSSGQIIDVMVGASIVVSAMVLGAVFPLVFARERRIVPAEGRSLPLFVPALQLGIGLTVLTASAMVAHHAARPQGSGPRIPEGGRVFQVSAPGLPPAERARHYAELLDQIGATVRPRLVSLTSPRAMVGLGMTDVATADCGNCYEGGIYARLQAVSATHLFVSADSFRALGVRVIAGRGIADEDRWGSRKVAVVNTRLAEKHFENGRPIGREIRIGREPDDWYTVVGIVEDPSRAALGSAVQPPYSVYLSILQNPAPSAELLVRGGASGEPGVKLAIERTIGAGSRNLVETDESSMLVAEAAPLVWFGRWFGIEGWAALLIAAVGTFAVMRLWVLSLVPELGVRRAVGARRRHLYLFILVRAMGVAIAGVAIAVWFGPALWESLTGVIAGLPQWDPHLLARYAALLVATTVAGALVPAIQAAHAHPAALMESTGE